MIYLHEICHRDPPIFIYSRVNIMLKIILLKLDLLLSIFIWLPLKLRFRSNTSTLRDLCWPPLSVSLCRNLQWLPFMFLNFLRTLILIYSLISVLHIITAVFVCTSFQREFYFLFHSFNIVPTKEILGCFWICKRE